MIVLLVWIVGHTGRRESAMFGIGMGLLGYCPGTSVAACGEGRRDAIAGVLGQLIGAGLFVAAYPWITPVINAGDFGKLTVPEATGVTPWLWIGAVALVGLAAKFGQSRFQSRSHSNPDASA